MKDWKEIDEDLILNYSEAHTGTSSQYERIMNKRLRESIEGLSKNLIFASGEIATFKEALCGIVGKINRSSNKQLYASILYFLGSFILTAVIAFSALVQAGVIKLK